MVWTAGMYADMYVFNCLFMCACSCLYLINLYACREADERGLHTFTQKDTTIAIHPASINAIYRYILMMALLIVSHQVDARQVMNGDTYHHWYIHIYQPVHHVNIMMN
jgi:hypothetical protein